MIRPLFRFSFLGLLALVLDGANCSTLIPKPPGRYAVGLSTAELVDSKRIDPYLPNNQPRAIMVSAFYPALESDNATALCPVPYMPSTSASILDQILYSVYGIPRGAFNALELQVACPSLIKTSCLSSERNFPVVLFSPGFTAPRLLYSAIAQYLSSFGYIVVTIDHPGDASVVEFPDGRVVLGVIPDNSTLDDLAASVVVRAQDTSFVLDSLSQASVVKQLIPGARSGLDVQKVVMYGHSLGGATATSASYNDGRIAGVVDLDGRLFGDVVTNGLPEDRYFLLVENPTHNRTSDDTLTEVWKHLSGWKNDFIIEGATHLSLMDVQLVMSLLGYLDQMEPILGTIKGERLMEILYKYLVEFFQLVFDGKEESLLKGPSKQFPEVVFPDN